MRLRILNITLIGPHSKRIASCTLARFEPHMFAVRMGSATCGADSKPTRVDVDNAENPGSVDRRIRLVRVRSESRENIRLLGGATRDLFYMVTVPDKATVASDGNRDVVPERIV